MRTKTILAVLVLTQGVSAPMLASRANAEFLPDDLTELSLDDLMNIQVTSVSKKAESLSSAAADIFVLSAADIKQSGARTLADALRLVPGLFVAKIDAHTWSVSARGFSGSVSDKLEVLLDGRSLYTPFFSGVFWDAQDTFLDDIDRIEVISGPGAALWGANAVNGVINIVTRSSAETQGLHAYAGAGNELEHDAGVRMGGSMSNGSSWRVYAKSRSIKDSVLSGGGEDDDAYTSAQGGFRLDTSSEKQDQFTLQGDVYASRLSNPNSAPPAGNNPRGEDDEVEGVNVLGRWQRSFDNQSSISLQMYVDHTVRKSPGSYEEERDTVDLAFQHTLAAKGRHSLIWGAGYRNSKDTQENPPAAAGTLQFLFLPAQRTLETYNFFVQDQYQLTDNVVITAGSKFEENDHTGLEVQPSLRFSWQLPSRQNLWGAVSRAVRIPNRLDDDFQYGFAGSPGPALIVGNTDFESEELEAFELGYRAQPLDNLSIDVTAFYNNFEKLRGVEPGCFNPTTCASLTPSRLVNNYSANVMGGKITSHWQPMQTLSVWASVSYLDLDLDPDNGTADTSTEASEDNDPRVQASLRANWQMNDRVHISAFLRHVGSLDNKVVKRANRPVASYTELDMRVGWQVSNEVELSVVGQNLLRGSHAEYGETRSGASAAAAAGVSEVERGFYLMLNWQPEY